MFQQPRSMFARALAEAFFSDLVEIHSVQSKLRVGASSPSRVRGAPRVRRRLRRGRTQKRKSFMSSSSTMAPQVAATRLLHGKALCLDLAPPLHSILKLASQKQQLRCGGGGGGIPAGVHLRGDHGPVRPLRRRNPPLRRRPAAPVPRVLPRRGRIPRRRGRWRLRRAAADALRRLRAAAARVRRGAGVCQRRGRRRPDRGHTRRPQVSPSRRRRRGCRGCRPFLRPDRSREPGPGGRLGVPQQPRPAGLARRCGIPRRAQAAFCRRQWREMDGHNTQACTSPGPGSGRGIPATSSRQPPRHRRNGNPSPPRRPVDPPPHRPACQASPPPNPTAPPSRRSLSLAAGPSSLPTCLPRHPPPPRPAAASQSLSSPEM